MEEELTPLNLEVMKPVTDYHELVVGDSEVIRDEPKTILELESQAPYAMEALSVTHSPSPHDYHHHSSNFFSEEWNHRLHHYQSPIYLTNPANVFYPLAGE